jgi:hypothetical protein
MTNTVEYYPRGVHLISKPLEKERTYQLPKNGSQYVNLYLDLKTIGYPDKYHMSSYVQNNNGTVLDTTYPVFIPPTPDTQCGLACVRPTWPNPIQGRPGIVVYPGITNTKTIPISSNAFIKDLALAYNQKYNVSVSEQKNNVSSIKLDFIPQKIELPSNGSNKWQLQITTHKPYGIYHILYNESFIKLRGLISGTRKDNLPLSVEVVKQPSPFEEVINNVTQTILFLTKNTEMLATVYLVVITLSIVLLVLFYFYYPTWRKHRQFILMDLKKNEILQINATVMVGVLILLTVGPNLLKNLNPAAISLTTASILVPFAVSSIMIIISKIPTVQVQPSPVIVENTDKVPTTLFLLGMVTMILGFAYMIGAVVTLSFFG